MTPDVEAIHRASRIAVMTNGDLYSVTHWFNEYGDDCEPAEAVSCVFGHCDIGWWSCELTLFTTEKVH